MFTKLFILAISVVYISTIRNPCRRNSSVEFHPHPESVYSYIQCSKRGQMFIKECLGDSQWLDSKKKCGEPATRKSQMSTLANKYKLSKLLAKKPLNEEHQKLVVGEVESKIEAFKNNIALKEKRLEEITSEQNAQELIDQTQAQLRTKEKLQIADQMNQQKDLHAKGHKKILQTQAEQNAREIDHLKQQIALQKDLVKKADFWAKFHFGEEKDSEKKEMDDEETEEEAISEDVIDNEEDEVPVEPETTNTTTTTTPKPSEIEQAQLDHQTDMLAKITSQQKFREELQLRHQKLMHDFFTKQRQHDETTRIKEHKKIVQKQIAEQNMKLKSQLDHQKMVNRMHEERLLKEKEMCSKVMCPNQYRCALEETDTLICLPMKL